jgi:hypothetical protein
LSPSCAARPCRRRLAPCHHRSRSRRGSCPWEGRARPTSRDRGPSTPLCPRLTAGPRSRWSGPGEGAARAERAAPRQPWPLEVVTVKAGRAAASRGRGQARAPAGGREKRRPRPGTCARRRGVKDDDGPLRGMVTTQSRAEDAGRP